MQNFLNCEIVFIRCDRKREENAHDGRGSSGSNFVVKGLNINYKQSKIHQIIFAIYYLTIIKFNFRSSFLIIEKFSFQM